MVSVSLGRTDASEVTTTLWHFMKQFIYIEPRRFSWFQIWCHVPTTALSKLHMTHKDDCVKTQAASHHHTRHRLRIKAGCIFIDVHGLQLLKHLIQIGNGAGNVGGGQIKWSTLFTDLLLLTVETHTNGNCNKEESVGWDLMAVLAWTSCIVFSKICWTTGRYSWASWKYHLLGNA